MSLKIKPHQSKTPKLPVLLSVITIAVAVFSIYFQSSPQYTTDAVVREIEVTSEPGTWRANIAATFVNSGNKQSFISNVNILYGAPESNDFNKNCSRSAAVYDRMELISIEDQGDGVTVPAGGTIATTYRFEAQKRDLYLDMAFPHELCVEYEAIGGNGKSFTETVYAGDYLVYNDRVEIENSPDDPKDPVRIIPNRSINQLVKDFLFGEK